MADLSECGCNACYSDPSGQSEHCENGPYWHATADALTKELSDVRHAVSKWVNVGFREEKDYLVEIAKIVGVLPK